MRLIKPRAESRAEELKKRYGFRTLADLNLDELRSISKCVVRNSRGKVVGWILRIEADKKTQRAKKVYICVPAKDAIGAEKVVAVSPSNLLIVDNFIFYVKEVSEEYVSRVVSVGLTNALSQLVALTEENHKVAVSSGIVEKRVLEERTFTITPKPSHMPAHKVDKAEIERKIRNLRIKEQFLREQLHELLQKWFNGSIHIDDYACEKARIEKELAEVRERIHALTLEISEDVRLPN